VSQLYPVFLKQCNISGPNLKTKVINKPHRIHLSDKHNIFQHTQSGFYTMSQKTNHDSPATTSTYLSRF